MTTAAQENARMLASVLGIGEDEAAERLHRTVLITAEDDPGVADWVVDIAELLSLTVNITADPTDDADAELVVGAVDARTTGPRLYAGLWADGATVGNEPLSGAWEQVHPFLAACAAPAVVAATLNLVIADEALPGVALPLVYKFGELGLPQSALEITRDLSGMVLVGAGAVAHGFLRALRHIPTTGTLPIIDPKTVAEGNFNRCTWLAAEDIGKDKATVLAERAQVAFSGLKLVPFVEDFHSYCSRLEPQRTAIVTVDSRRVRRSIQNEVPGRVLDASTTGVHAVVVHTHTQPTTGACLSCIYPNVPEEFARERAIAEGLGVDLADVQCGLITAESAARIQFRYPEINPGAIVGRAYDSLFKALCSAQALTTPEGKQVLAPFSFVSALAGAYLVIELMRSEDGVATTNYWTADPWGVPSLRRRVQRPKLANCEFCSTPAAVTIVNALWGQKTSSIQP